MKRTAENGQVIIGLGSGRCGTQSLAQLLDRQSGSRVTHERVYQNIRWSGSEDRVFEMLRWTRELPGRGLKGDVASYYLPYVEFIWKHEPSARFICLRRPRDETVDSFMRITAGKNHWSDHQGIGWEKDLWDDSFPSYPVEDKKSALERYWIEYYAEAERLQALRPGRFALFDTAALNHREGQRALLTFAGIPLRRQKLKPGIRRNTQADRVRYSRKLAARKRRQEWIEKLKRLVP